MSRRIEFVDVFGDGMLAGNPVAVVLDGAGLSTEQMQQLTRWLDLSETTFVLPPMHPAANYQVRIFTPSGELPFAGHPTLGTCHAWLGSGSWPDSDHVVQECVAGLVPIRRTQHGLSFLAPPIMRGGAVEKLTLNRIADALGIDTAEVIDSQWIDNGPGWIGVLLTDAHRVLEIQPDFSRLGDSDPFDIGIAGKYPDGAPCAIEVRAFFAGQWGELREDPITGSLNASLAQWLTSAGHLAAPYTASQGTQLGRRGRPRIEQDADGIWVAGATTTIVRGECAI